MVTGVPNEAYGSWPVKLAIVTEDSHAVLQSPVALQIVTQPLLVFETWVELCEKKWVVLLPSRHLLRKSEPQAIKNLPEGGVGIGQFAADEMLALAVGLIVLEHPLKVG